MNKYAVMVQASPEEILQAQQPGDLNLLQLQEWTRIREILVVLPEMQGVEEALQRLATWKVPAYAGDTYNVCRRIVAAHRAISREDFAVRVLAIWKHIDRGYVDRLVDRMWEKRCDAVLPPRDFDVTCAADIASLSALERIGEMQGDCQEVARAKFNPWGYMDMHPELFTVDFLEPAPVYDEKKREEVLSSRGGHPENEFFGRDYAGSRYHFLDSLLPGGKTILDIACGSGSGAHLLSQKASLVVGVDFLESYVLQAQERYPESSKLKFLQGDGAKFLYQGKEEQFDIVVSLHTLEHVPNDVAMLKNIHRNLRPDGLLIVEVPLLSRRPLGVPSNPFHLREYGKDDFIQMLENVGFKIKKVFGSCRSFYGRVEDARDALQVHAVKIS